MIIGCITLVPVGQTFPGDYRRLAAIDCAKGRGIILPGGKWEKSELFEEAAYREFREETNCFLDSLPKLFYQGFCDFDNYCYTFLGECCSYSYDVTTPEGRTLWATWDDLMKSSFRAYYSLLKQTVVARGFWTGD